MCLSPKLVVGYAGVADDSCSTCYCRDHERPARTGGQCVHLGPRVEMVECAPCGQAARRKVQLPVHLCMLHGRCTIGRKHPSMACCLGCVDRRPEWVREGVGAVRHLTYFLFPRGPMWRWNVQQLRERISLFSGLRAVWVACGDGADDAAEVQQELAGLDCTFFLAPNHAVLKEQVAQEHLLTLASKFQGEADVTFYGHAKGVSSYAFGSGVKTWAAEMYTGNLDYWPAVRSALVEHVSCGVWRRRTRHPPGVPVSWHYAGSFRWTRNRDVYRRNWQAMPLDWSAPEVWPGQIIGYEESACLYGETATCHAWHYGQEHWDAWASAHAEAWRAAHVAERWRPMLLSVLITAHAQPALVHEAIASVRAQTSDAWQCLIVSSGRIEAAGGDPWGRYRDDARVSVLLTDEAGDGRPRGQAAAINAAYRSGRVRGDLVLHLSDDDLLHPRAVEALLARAAAQPGEGAWYGLADLQRIHPSGAVQVLGQLRPDGVGRPGRQLRCLADGMQVCHRRQWLTPWPEDAARAAQADGWWADALAARTPVVPLSVTIGTHRHTPRSTFTS